MQSVCNYMCSGFANDKDYDLTMVDSGAAWITPTSPLWKTEIMNCPMNSQTCYGMQRIALTPDILQKGAAIAAPFAFYSSNSLP